jgi:hypothetical protein
LTRSHGSSIGESCEFTSADGVRWLVREYRASEPAPGNDSCLVFECDAAMRRVCAFPPHWRELSSEELLDLSWMT